MPTYEYHCAACDRSFDMVQSFHDDPLTECPTCDSPVRKVFGNVGIVFKGSGFYKTDSRSGGSKSSSGASSGSDSSGSDSSSSSSDSSSSSSSTDSSSGSKVSEGSKASDGASSKPASTKTAAPS